MAECSFSNCGREVAIKGLCDTHYRQTKRGKPLTPIGSSFNGRPGTKDTEYVPGTIWQETEKVDHRKPMGGGGSQPMTTVILGTVTIPDDMAERARRLMTRMGADDLLEYLFDSTSQPV